MHSTAQHSTAQHSTAQHSTAQHSTAQHSTAQHSTAQHSLDYLGQGLFVKPFSKSSLISKELVGSFCVGDFLLFDNEGVAA